MKQFLSMIAAAALISGPVHAASHAEVTEEIIEQIEDMLAEMECQMDPDDIEVEEDGYDLDDVICKGGHQFDIKLDKDLNEVSRRAE